MTGDTTQLVELDHLRKRAANARRKAQTARTTQERQHFDGMADFWQELLDERLAAIGGQRWTEAPAPSGRLTDAA